MSAIEVSEATVGTLTTVVAQVTIAVTAGYAEDPPGRAGLAHLTEHVCVGLAASQYGVTMAGGPSLDSQDTRRGNPGLNAEESLFDVFVFVLDSTCTATSKGSVALSVRMIEADLSREVINPSAHLSANDVGVRRIPVPGRGDHGRGPLVPAVQSVLPRR